MLTEDENKEWRRKRREKLEGEKIIWAQDEEQNTFLPHDKSDDDHISMQHLQFLEPMNLADLYLNTVLSSAALPRSRIHQQTCAIRLPIADLRSG